MAPKWLSKVPWTSVIELVLDWWKGRKHDSSKGDGQVQKTNDKSPMDSKPS